jgi:hypothetical protein
MDGDGVGDICDNCLDVPNGPLGGTCTEGLTGTCFSDSECDTVPGAEDGVCSMNQENSDTDFLGDACDNCPEVYNPDQEDCDQNGVGDLCSLGDFDDLDGDGVDNIDDVCDYTPPNAVDDVVKNHPNHRLLGTVYGDVDGDCDRDADDLAELFDTGPSCNDGVVNFEPECPSGTPPPLQK